MEIANCISKKVKRNAGHLNFLGNRLENATSVGWYDCSLSYFDGARV